jgi:alanyl-tRNA synthetase
LLTGAAEVNGVRVVGALVEAADVKGMRELGDRLRDRLQSGVVALAMQGDGKVTWVTMVTKDLTGRLHAGHLARDLAKLTGGGGGGRPDMAEAGGKDPSKIPDALAKLSELVRGQLKA